MNEHSDVFLQPSVAIVHFRIPVDWKNVSIKLEGVVLDTDGSMLPVEGQSRVSPTSRRFPLSGSECVQLGIKPPGSR